MRKITLPNGMRYKIENTASGIIIPGTDTEPIATFQGRNACIQYRLVTWAIENNYECGIVQDNSEGIISSTYNPGDLSTEELDSISEWVTANTTSILKKIGVRHFIRFKKESDCYYDFDIHKLIGAYGTKEKKGPLDGEACSLSKSELGFLLLLTRSVNISYNISDVVEWLENYSNLGRDSIQQTWYRFRKYDESIRETFDREGDYFVYRGLPQVWSIGKEHDDILSLAGIFKILCHLDILAIYDRPANRIESCFNREARPEYIIQFLGFNNSSLEMQSIGIERFFNDNCTDSSSSLARICEKIAFSLEAFWNHIRTCVEENIKTSISVSTFYHDAGVLPKHKSELSAYSVSNERLRISMQRVCNDLQDYISKSDIANSYFDNCTLAVSPDSIFDYLTALTLIVFCRCQGNQSDTKLSSSKKILHEKLSLLIRELFDFSPPDIDITNIYEEVRKLVSEQHADLLAGRFEDALSKNEKIFNLINIYSLTDVNYLISSTGREL